MSAVALESLVQLGWAGLDGLAIECFNRYRAQRDLFPLFDLALRLLTQV
jgi:hypothetical protein